MPEGGTTQDYSIYDKAEREHISTYGYVCGVAVIPCSYLVCAYLIFEGLYLLCKDRPLQLGLAADFSKSESGFLYILAWGDIVVAVIGAIGIWSTSKMHSTIAIAGSGILLGWRCLVCVSFVPWAGIMLAFSSATTNKVSMFVFICVYFAFSIFLVYILMMAFRQVMSNTMCFQQHLDAQAERKKLLIAGESWAGNFDRDGEDMTDIEVEPVLFGVLPLAETVSLYAAVIAVACMWNFLHLMITRESSGGWAFFSSTPKVDTTFWLEILLWPLSFCCAFIGLAGASKFCESVFNEEKQSTYSLLVFLLGSMLRFGLLFAVTGMNIIEKNTCGFYVNGLATLAYSSPLAPRNGFWFHCLPNEYLFLAGALACCTLDGYLIWGTFQLWTHCKDRKFDHCVRSFLLGDSKASCLENDCQAEILYN